MNKVVNRVEELLNKTKIIETGELVCSRGFIKQVFLVFIDEVLDVLHGEKKIG
jgi:hypothetical protein